MQKFLNKLRKYDIVMVEEARLVHTLPFPNFEHIFESFYEFMEQKVCGDLA